MSSAAYSLCMLFSLWGSSLCHTLLTVGPCVGDTEKATFDCSRRKLTSVPQHIWANVTELDLSENHLHLLHTNAQRKLRHLGHLIKLNLSGNDLPLLVKQSFYLFPSLEILDLSGCKVAAIETGALLNFPRLRKLFLSISDLRTPMSAVLQGHEWVDVIDHTSNQASDRTKDFNMASHSLFLRKLLTESLENMINATDANDKKPSDSWKYLVAVLVIAISLSVLIAIGAKCKIFQRYLASYRHSRLSEGDGASQCDPASFEVGFSSRGNIPNSDTVHGNLEDDDGFIEDNYIQASERERAEREAKHWQEDDEDEDMEEFSIG
ncbi:type III endosome membrane protein TEMP [Tachysurus fulvidraco]|uniref:type III endosome membrane protein TEMP n=1 Tax=Tachysurus fulvidraco TaxID=1234273 RepID=UPI000F4F66EA|nr:type III endosome membrane protein TEMP [Tachysurus fulvidraco]XP_027010220.1 type III endosome membrane protein TEMP [Tachysurus fulvidraco]XP_047670329.1 type III endosome membrane protein TEMP [Tachysurus fulvidraco]XP_047670330.1 type III endosome membrane protein TEMP [Tachysurus fulvidraco]